MSDYPSDWPRCPACGDFALDGHITCGRWQCNEHFWRRATDRVLGKKQKNEERLEDE